MCGIAAIFGHGVDAPPVDRNELIAIRDRMIHRGPDGEGLWISEDRRVGLAHRRLTIVDLTDAGHQPMWNSDRTLCVNYNGEIYNYPALRAQLSERGFQFVSNCDTEALLHLYAEKGPAMMNDLRGMYAFTIWDAKERTLFCARDPFGIKPLYYADDGKTVRIASQVKALLAGGRVDTTPDPAGHVGFFLWGAAPDPFTLYRGIRALPAGHSLTIREGAPPQEKSFCSIPDIFRNAETAARGAPPVSDDQREILHRALRDSAEHHLMADVPVGIFLSAGLDSSTLAALVSERHHDVRTVTLGLNEYRGTEQDETALAEVVARTFKTNHQTIWITRRDFEADASRLLYAMDRPSTDGVNTYFVSLATKRAGLKVALSGLGGDELFGGYPSFRDVPRVANALRHFRALGKFGRGFRLVTQDVIKHFVSPKYAGIFEYGSSFPGAYLLRRSLFMPWELPEFLDPEVVREGWRRLNTFGELATFCDSLASDRLKVSALELGWYMRHQLLRDSDWAGMAHSLEIRVPLVDVTLLREIAPLLASPHPPGKRDMALSPNTPLPDAVMTRPKTGFVMPVREWLLQSFDPLAAKERGLRGWARYVHGEFAEASGAASSVLRRKHLGRSRRSGGSGNSRIVVYRIGQLGDTIVALPAMRAVRENFPDAHIELLCDRHPGTNYVLAADVLTPMGIFDDFITYEVSRSKHHRRSQFANLEPLLRKKHFDTVVYLAPSQRRKQQILRDWMFFRFVGIRHFIGFRNFPRLPKKRSGEPLPRVDSEADLLLSRLAADGIKVPPPYNRSIDLRLSREDEERAEHFLSRLRGQRVGPWIGIGPGCKQPVNQWPPENYAAALKLLIARYKVVPIVFGGAEDVDVGDFVLRGVACGLNLAGKLDIRATAAAMRQCALFLGNDTGTMHIAAAAHIPCIGIYSARQWRGLWEPYTPIARVLRSEIECEGCELRECIVRKKECLTRISPGAVVEACAEFLEAVRPQLNRINPSQDVINEIQV
jgi:asparagine synthase (glutamine-hydrolysing)